MKARGDGREARGERMQPRAAGLLPIACYMAAMALAFWGVFQLDVPLARWIQGIDEPWFEQLGLIGQWLGDWRVLLGISGVLLALGAVGGNGSLRQAGVATLLAHAYAAGAVQSLKHLVGRARPRLTLESSFLIGPNFDSGFDSFPSGHTTASVAIATVIARRFPRYAWPAYGVAAVITVSRVIKGSHFPGDVLAGICLGSFAGHMAALPLSQWREGLAQGVRAVWPWIVGIAAMVIVMAQSSSDGPIPAGLAIAGGVLLLLGVVLRWQSGGKASPAGRWGFPMIGLGLACTTGSWQIALLALIVVGAMSLDQSAGVSPILSERRTVPVELALLISLGLLAVAIQATRGFHPLP